MTGVKALEEQAHVLLLRTDELLASFNLRETRREDFLAARFEAGLAWVQFAEGHGGLGADPVLQSVVDDRIRSVAGPRFCSEPTIGHLMAAPTIHEWGSERQKLRFLRPLYIEAERWCQLFSEPDAGSDLANLGTRAEVDGDEWVINGQKVWTSLAHESQWGLLLARSDRSASKHRGLTFFLVEMGDPAIEVKPLRQMTGDAEFNEVFMTDVRVPDYLRLGEPGEGWRVALTTLMYERVAADASLRAAGPIDEVLRLWHSLPSTGRSADGRDRLARLWCEAQVNRYTSLRAAEMRRKGRPGPEGSVAKLHGAVLNQQIYELGVDLLGPVGMLYGSYETPPNCSDGPAQQLRWTFLRSRANSIEGGTSEIMRNIIGERVLGLARDGL